LFRNNGTKNKLIITKKEYYLSVSTSCLFITHWRKKKIEHSTYYRRNFSIGWARFSRKSTKKRNRAGLTSVIIDLIRLLRPPFGVLAMTSILRTTEGLPVHTSW